uniref:(northern house mosquito) hypothetical protein n=1 Tax=Culex pipiens TaxID=7175 RepID=A0A8D8BKH3_CULPI
MLFGSDRRLVTFWTRPPLVEPSLIEDRDPRRSVLAFNVELELSMSSREVLREKDNLEVVGGGAGCFSPSVRRLLISIMVLERAERRELTFEGTVRLRIGGAGRILGGFAWIFETVALLAGSDTVLVTVCDKLDSVADLRTLLGAAGAAGTVVLTVLGGIDLAGGTVLLCKLVRIAGFVTALVTTAAYFVTGAATFFTSTFSSTTFLSSRTSSTLTSSTTSTTALSTLTSSSFLQYFSKYSASVKFSSSKFVCVYWSSLST